VAMVSSQELETILNHSRDAFLLADNEGRILFFNSAIEELSGFSLKKYLGKNLKLLVNKGLISYSTALEAIEKKQTITGKIETYKGKKQLVTSVPVINRSGSLDRVVCNIRGLDINNVQPQFIFFNNPIDAFISTFADGMAGICTGPAITHF
jgi:PAS domain S-box-containing protein